MPLNRHTAISHLEKIMPKNVWEYVTDNSNSQSPFVGWQIDCDAFADSQFHGLYRIRANFCGGLFRFKSPKWTRWDVPPMGIPIPLIQFNSSGNEPYCIQKDLKNINLYRVETVRKLYFYFPAATWILNHNFPEWSHTKLTLSGIVLTAAGNYTHLKVPLGAQSSTSEHSGFGVVHVFRQRAKIFDYELNIFISDVSGLLTNVAKVLWANTEELWIVGHPFREKRVSGRQRVRWLLIAKKRNDELVFHTLIPKQDSAEFNLQIGLDKTAGEK